MKKISRKKAAEKGLTRYFTGEPCKNGHKDERSVVGRQCLQCQREYKKKFRKKTTREIEKIVLNDVSKYKKILKEKYVLDKKTGCWNWTGWKNENGYGYISIKCKSQKAHRISYVAFNEKVIENECIMHACDNPGCINPKHLSEGSLSENTRDMVRKGRHGKQG